LKAEGHPLKDGPGAANSFCVIIPTSLHIQHHKCKSVPRGNRFNGYVLIAILHHIPAILKDMVLTLIHNLPKHVGICLELITRNVIARLEEYSLAQIREEREVRCRSENFDLYVKDTIGQDNKFFFLARNYRGGIWA
jgi:hypothetical protein